jgi:hypothetical protein
VRSTTQHLEDRHSDADDGRENEIARIRRKSPRALRIGAAWFSTMTPTQAPRNMTSLATERRCGSPLGGATRDARRSPAFGRSTSRGNAGRRRESRHGGHHAGFGRGPIDAGNPTGEEDGVQRIRDALAARPRDVERADGRSEVRRRFIRKPRLKHRPEERRPRPEDHERPGEQPERRGDRAEDQPDGHEKERRGRGKPTGESVPKTAEGESPDHVDAVSGESDEARGERVRSEIAGSERQRPEEHVRREIADRRA